MRMSRAVGIVQRTVMDEEVKWRGSWISEWRKNRMRRQAVGGGGGNPNRVPV